MRVWSRDCCFPSPTLPPHHCLIGCRRLTQLTVHMSWYPWLTVTAVVWCIWVDILFSFVMSQTLQRPHLAPNATSSLRAYSSPPPPCYLYGCNTHGWDAEIETAYSWLKRQKVPFFLYREFGLVGHGGNLLFTMNQFCQYPLRVGQWDF